jgi:hypothetical protein
MEQKIFLEKKKKIKQIKEFFILEHELLGKGTFGCVFKAYKLK